MAVDERQAANSHAPSTLPDIAFALMSPDVLSSSVTVRCSKAVTDGLEGLSGPTLRSRSRDCLHCERSRIHLRSVTRNLARGVTHTMSKRKRQSTLGESGMIKRQEVLRVHSTCDPGQG